MKRILLAATILVLISSSAFAFGLSSLTGAGSSNSTALTADQIQGQFSNASKDYTAATKNFLLSASVALEAFNSKTSADRLKSEANQLGSGTVSTDDISKRTALLKSANDEVTAKLKSGEKLSEAGKTKISQSMVYMGKGIATEVPLVSNVVTLSKNTVDSMKSLSVTQIGKVRATASVLSALSSSLPKDLGLAKDTMGMYFDYAKSNNIEIPKDASDVFASK